MEKLLGTVEGLITKEKEKKGRKDNDRGMSGLKEQQKVQGSSIVEMQKKIKEIKRRIENIYDNNGIVQKENELVDLGRQVDKLRKERDGLKGVQGNQRSRLDYLNNEGDYEQKCRKVGDELKKEKERNRQMNEQLNQQERRLRQIHEKNIENEEKTKEIYGLISSRKQEKVSDGIGVESVEQMGRRMDELKKEKEQIDKEYYRQMKIIDKQKKELVYEQEKNMLVMREKEKEQRINQIKKKEIIKLFTSNMMDGSANVSRYSKMSDSRLIQKNRQNYYKPKLSSANQSKRNRHGSIGNVNKSNVDDKLSSIIQENKSKLVNDQELFRNKTEDKQDDEQVYDDDFDNIEEDVQSQKDNNKDNNSMDDKDNKDDNDDIDDNDDKQQQNDKPQFSKPQFKIKV